MQLPVLPDVMNAARSYAMCQQPPEFGCPKHIFLSDAFVKSSIVFFWPLHGHAGAIHRQDDAGSTSKDATFQAKKNTDSGWWLRTVFGSGDMTVTQNWVWLENGCGGTADSLVLAVKHMWVLGGWRTCMCAFMRVMNTAGLLWYWYCTYLGGYQGKQVLKKRYIFIKCWYLWCAFILILTQVLSLTELSNEKQNLLDILQDFIPRVSKPESMNDYGCSTFLPFFSPKPKPRHLLSSAGMRTVHRHYFTLFTAHMFLTPPQLFMQPSGMHFQHVSLFMVAGLILTWRANRVDLFTWLLILVVPRSPEQMWKQLEYS